METVRRLGESIFVAEGRAEPSRREVLTGALGVLALAIVAGMRASAVTTTMWAEDGRVFLGDALGHGSLRSLFRGYNGYSHVVPRLVAAVAALFPVEDAAWVIGVMASLIVGALAVFCARAARGHIHTTAGRYVYAALIVLLPVAGVEVLGNLANLHWFLVIAAFWAAVWRPADRRNIVLACVIVVLAMWSDPLTAFIAPLLLWRVVTVKEWRDRAVAIAFAGAALVESVVVLTTEGAGVTPSLRSALRLLEQRVGIGSLLGVDGTQHFVDRFGGAGVHIGFLVIVIGAAALWLRYARAERLFIAVTVVAASGLFVVCIALRGGGSNESFINGVVGGGSRYTVAPMLLVLGCAIALFERTNWRVAVAAATAMLAVAVVDFHPPTLRNRDMTWARGIAMARTTCRFGTDPTAIPILPITETKDWFVPASCRYVGE